MPELTRRAAFAATFLMLVGGSAPHAALAQTAAFDPAQAFCDRQTFELESLDEVAPWLDYVGGLRNGRSNPPDPGCASTTVRAILGVVGSQDLETAKAQRAAFYGFYTAKALQPESSERATDTDESFRYRNDVTLAGFVWLLCPGNGDERFGCVKEVVGQFPSEFTETSPVFCDFATLKEGKVERPTGRVDLPLACAAAGKADSDAWLQRTAGILGE